VHVAELLCKLFGSVAFEDHDSLRLLVLNAAEVNINKEKRDPVFFLLFLLLLGVELNLLYFFDLGRVDGSMCRGGCFNVKLTHVAIGDLL
jgi:hypothetical protein